MSVSNEELVRRADLALADLSAVGGLSVEQADSFIDMVFDQPTILRQVRQVRMNAPERKVSKVGFAERILHAATQARVYDPNDGSTPYDDTFPENRYLQASKRAKPTFSQLAMQTKEMIAEVRLPYEVLEDNIEGQSFEAHIMRLIAERAAIDLEEYALFADTGSADDFLALQDGYLKRMTSNIVDNASSGIGPALFKNGLLTMPQKFLRNTGQLRHYISVANEIKYRDVVAQRATGYGDSMLTGDQPIRAFGVPVENAPMLVADGVGNKGFLTFPQNLLFGIQRNISIETAKDIRSREWIVVLTCRIALQIEEEEATVKYIAI